MNRYLLTFYKKDNMRFISHLDLQRLFQRAIKRGDVHVAYSNGFNPHELINIVSPLSLGFEGLAEFLEIDTLIPYEFNDLIERMNLAMPNGIKFISCEELERKNQSTSCPTISAVYTVVFNDKEIVKNIDLQSFLKQDEIIIKKKDKKTGTLVDKNVKDRIYNISRMDDGFAMELACASNFSLNPVNLLSSLFTFSGLEFAQSMCKICRTRINR